jgi:hypothetical protein
MTFAGIQPRHRSSPNVLVHPAPGLLPLTRMAPCSSGGGASIDAGRSAIGRGRGHLLQGRDDLIAGPMRFADGAIDLSAGPRLSIAVDEEKVRRYLVR